eukprot:TRINITY_DN8197_c0_g1_i1.p1 TRINITY_DN8197_c0_g1~~TRINITY_DN8197_c0_g1_i1.p1  ORF type:complete len:531 (+),score=117.33 TRINITY_DN8197_c0_g1_i1:37-1629(+)
MDYDESDDDSHYSFSDSFDESDISQFSDTEFEDDEDDDYEDLIYLQWASRKTVNLIIVSLPIILIPLSSLMFLPAYPVIQEDFGTSNFLMSLTLSLFCLFQGIFTIIYQPLSDRYGRRIGLCSCVTVFVGSTLLLSGTLEIYSLIIFRAIQAASIAGFVIYASGTISDMIPPKKRKNIYYFLLLPSVVGLLLAPATGGLLCQYVSWRSIFWVQFVISFPMTLLIYWKMPETLQAVIDEKRFFASKSGHNIHINVNEEEELIKRNPNFYFTNELHRPSINPLKQLKTLSNYKVDLIIFTRASTFAGMFLILYVLTITLQSEDYFNYSPLIASIFLIPFGIGNIAGSFLGSYIVAFSVKYLNHIFGRLVPSILTSFLTVVTIILFGCTIDIDFTISIITTFFIGLFASGNRAGTYTFIIQQRLIDFSNINAVIVFCQFFLVFVELLFSATIIAYSSIFWLLMLSAFIILISLPFTTYVMYKLSKEYHAKEQLLYYYNHSTEYDISSDYESDSTDRKNIQYDTNSLPDFASSL